MGQPILVSILTPCFNEKGNIRDLYMQVKRVFEGLPHYQFEYIFIDNASTDGTVDILKAIAADDKRVKIIVNTRNFGAVRSPHYGLMQAHGEAVINLVADFQDPPEMIPQFLQKWQEGFKMVLGIKKGSEESMPMRTVRKIYYRIIKSLAETDLINDFTGFGLYDRTVIEVLRKIDDPYPYFRGLICELGFPRVEIEYHQPARKMGITKSSFYTMYDTAMLGMTNHSKVPLRLMTMFGFLSAFISLLAGLGYLIYKLVFWNSFSVGIAPLVIGLFFLGSILLLFLGIVGEYVGAIHTQVLHRPLVIERERINFH